MSITTTTEFTVTEWRRRLRPITRQLARMEGLGRGEYSIEVDERTHPVATYSVPTDAELWPGDDDLLESARVDEPRHYLWKAGLLHHGACVHVRVYALQSQGWGEVEKDLANVFVVWMGTPDAEAIVVSAPGHEG